MPRYFIQIGAGAGDLDRRANYRDGFSEVVKNLKLQESDRVVLIEPNPLNIEKLKLSWKNFKNVDIYPIGISTDDSFTTQNLLCRARCTSLPNCFYCPGSYFKAL